LAQEDGGDESIEEIVTVGSQIRGANIRDALAVSVVTSEDIENIGVDSGDELLEFMAEQGQNFFSEAENISGGVNSARGDVGAYNLRNLGTGNTLVLVNGRRVVNSATYQTERVGGSFIPVNTANSQSLPVFGLERIEVLRDGASAIYGADAVAGVVNYVMKDDFDGFSLRARYADWEGISRNDYSLTMEWGNTFNDGRSNLSIFANYYHRDPVFAQEDPRWAQSDHRWKIPEGSPFEGDTSFRRDSANGRWGQFDSISSVAGITTPIPVFDSAGEFQMYPLGDPRCTWVYNEYACGAPDSSANSTPRHNLNEHRDLYSDLDRMNVFAFFNHEFGSGLEAYTELSAYWSETVLRRHRSTKLGAVASYEVAADAYYNPLGPCGSPNRLPVEVIGDDSTGGVPCTGLDLRIDLYGWVESPRIVNNDGDMFRFVQGFRGELGDWDWDTGVVWSRATKEDVTKDRISNTLIQAALNDPTPAGYNPFTGGYDTNIEQAQIDVRRDNETELTLIDFKMSNAELFNMPAGPVGFLAGVEWREESFVDDRDPRLDGTINYTDNAGVTYPFVADVMNSSPTADSEGSRDVFSAYFEFQVPLLESLDLQAAMRYEDFSDVGDTTVGKIAMGWRPFDRLLVRGSWSEAYRVPNLVTVNETGVARSNTVTDYLCEYVDPDEDTLWGGGCSYSIQRTAAGSDELVAEESTNTSLGVVWDATDWLTITVDWWAIEKEDTIGLFGEANHTALDLLNLLEAGTGNCAGAVGNPAVVRDPNYEFSQEELDLFTAAGICPVGEAQRVDDRYENLDTRKISGHDIGIYINHETGAAGQFNFSYVGTRLDEYEQLAGGNSQVLLDAVEDGTLPPSVDVRGFDDLVRQNGNPRWKHTARVNWRMGDWGASISGAKVTDVVETRAGLGSDGSQWVIKPMSTYNASVDYRFNTFGDTDARIRLGVLNFTDARASLSTQFFGYLADVNRDLPRSWYLDLRLDF
jgi:outer membrane receptor protein involved in Fe transport